MDQEEWQDNVQQQFDALSSVMSGKKRVKRRELPDFSGEQSTDAEEWLDLATKLSTFNNIKITAEKDIVPEVVLWMGLAMTGLAHTWYTSLSLRILINFKLFVTEFRSFFVHVNVHQHIADFHKRVQSPNESVTAFYLSLQKYISRSGELLKPQDHKHQFEEGLLPILKRYVLEKETTTLSQSFIEARKQEALLQRLDNNKNINTNYISPSPSSINLIAPSPFQTPPPLPPTTTTTTTQAQLQQQLQNMQIKIQALQSKVTNQQRQIQQYQTQNSGIPQQNSKNSNFSKNSNRNSRNRMPYMARGRNSPQNSQQQQRPFCNFCRAVGHRAFHCRKRKMYMSGQIQQITCRNCHGMGHYAHMCNLPNQQQVPQEWLYMETNPSPNRTLQYQQRSYQPRQQLQPPYPTPPPPTTPQKYSSSLFGTYSTVPQIGTTRLQPSQITPLPPTTPQLLTPPLPTQVNVIDQQQHLQQQLQQLQLQQRQIQLHQLQNHQVLQPVAPPQLQNSLPSTDTNDSTFLFQDSVVGDQS